MPSPFCLRTNSSGFMRTGPRRRRPYFIWRNRLHIRWNAQREQGDKRECGPSQTGSVGANKAVTLEDRAAQPAAHGDVGKRLWLTGVEAPEPLREWESGELDRHPMSVREHRFAVFEIDRQRAPRLHLRASEIDDLIGAMRFEQRACGAAEIGSAVGLLEGCQTEP